MKNIFAPDTVTEITGRLARLTPASQPRWGTMNAPQMLAHCSAGIEMAEGKVTPPRMLIGRLLGPLAKQAMITRGRPMPRNATTAKSLVVGDHRDFSVEQQRLHQSIHRFASGGPEACTRHPHFFFGRLTPQEWAALVYQHLDHHLRQFGV